MCCNFTKLSQIYYPINYIILGACQKKMTEHNRLYVDSDGKTFFDFDLENMVPLVLSEKISPYQYIRMSLCLYLP